MPATDSEIASAYSISMTGSPGERQEAGAVVFNHFRDDRMARQLREFMPNGMPMGLEWLGQIEKARYPGDLRSGQRRTSEASPFLPPWFDQYGIKPRRNRMPTRKLYQIARDNPVISAILANYFNRTMRFLDYVEPAQYTLLNQTEGFNITRLGRSNSDDLGDEDEAEKRRIISFIENCGDRVRFPLDGSPSREDGDRRDSLRAMVSKYIDNRFIVDAIGFELVRSNNNRDLSSVHIVDGQTLRHLFRPNEIGYGKQKIPGRDPSAIYAQVFEDQLWQQFRAQDMWFGSVNISTIADEFGYGLSEVEASYRLTEGILNVLTMTHAQWDKNTIPEQIIALSGHLPSEQLALLKEEWSAYREDPSGGFGLPLIWLPNGGDVKSIALNKGKQDIVFPDYVNLNMALCSALFGVDISEINASPVGGGNSSLSGGKEMKAKLDDSRSRGFIPHLQTLQGILNEIYSPLLQGKWKFQFAGLNPQDPVLMGELLKATGTVDEIRQGFFKAQPLGGLVGNSLAQNPAVSQMIIAATTKGIDPGGKLGDEIDVPKPEPVQPPKIPKAKSKKKETLKALLELLMSEEDDE
jgi:hypothetical protein